MTLPPEQSHARLPYHHRTLHPYQIFMEAPSLNEAVETGANFPHSDRELYAYDRELEDFKESEIFRPVTGIT